MLHETRLVWLIGVQVFVCGAAVMGLEILGSRFLAPHFGSTLFVWGSLIGVILTSLSVGYYLGGKISDRNPNFRTFSLIILSAGVYAILIAILSPAVFKFVLSLRLSEKNSPLLATILLFAVPGVLLGMISPYAIKLRAQSLEAIGRLAGNLYTISTIGSIVGTFLTVFTLIPAFGVLDILYGISILLIATSLPTLSHKLKAIGIILIALVIALATSNPIKISGIIYEKFTPYQHLLVMDDNVTGIRSLIMDNFVHSAMDLENPNAIVFAYTGHFHLGFLFNPSIQNVLFIGGGGFSGPTRFINDYDWVSVDVIEIDADVTDTAKKYFHLESDERLEIFDQDGRRFLANSDMKYDLIVMDAYAKSYVPFHLMTLEFLQEVEKHLTPEGVLISNVVSPLKGKAAELFRAEYKTMQSVFPNIYVFPVSKLDPTYVQNQIVIATKSKKYYSKAELNSLFQERHFMKISQIPEYLDHYWDKSIDVSNSPILTDDYAPVENLMNPLTGLAYWRKVGGKNVLVDPLEKFMIEPDSLNLDRQTMIIVGLGLCLGLGIWILGNSPR